MGIEEPDIEFLINEKLVDEQEYHALCKWFRQIALPLEAGKYSERQISN